MGKFQNDAEALLKNIGGKENVAAVTHCATRMRFVLNDPSKANEKEIENIASVKGMFTNAGQFQIIIGNEVSVFFNDFVAVSGIEGVSKEQSKSIAKKNQNPVQQVVGVLAVIFSPILPAIIIGGLILGFRNILEAVDFGNGTIASNSVFWNGVNEFLWLPGEAIFHFLPVGITWSITRRMKTTQILGIVLGITLVSPQLLNAYSVSSTAAADIPFWDFGFAQIDKIGYQAQVIPAMLAGFMLVYLEKIFRKRIPEAVSMIFVPLFSLIPTIMAAHVLLGPIGWTIGGWISNIVNFGLSSSFNWLFSFIFGAFYAPLVITGLHHTTLAIDYQLIADFGTTSWWPMVFISNIAQGSAVLAVYFLHRGNKKEEQISIPATISAYLGVTEPAMFGINLKYVYPFVAAMIGSAFGSMFITITNTQALSVGVGGLPGFLSFPFQKWPTVFISMAISISVTFILTFIFRKVSFLNKVEPLEAQADDAKSVGETMKNANISVDPSVEKALDFYSPVKGKLIPIENVDDPVFSPKMMGDGFAVVPADQTIYSPIDGTIVSIFQTKHAIGLLADNGIEVLVHMGIDTVALDAKPFSVLISEGEKVSAGTPIATMDTKQVIELGKKTDVIVAITNSNIVQEFDFISANTVDSKQSVGTIVLK
ncbi:PTS system trehalose-specific EIIBC component [Vagococcus elongatus]|uniref:PTS system sucrose-specific EIIBCA component n=1 Tax=Vagococcus elongatus TaxID=180344 RepID=A0A430B481_9ENTE|nr:PTS system trehalose-specific EIIBC component [Vagococcus elongatus]RSU15147.1 PTS trehalose transporter subunit IIBC [Vagococcus elongatus]